MHNQVEKDISKIKNINKTEEEIQWIINDILDCLNNENTIGLTTLSAVGNKNLFRGQITKNQINPYN